MQTEDIVQIAGFTLGFLVQFTAVIKYVGKIKADTKALEKDLKQLKKDLSDLKQLKKDLSDLKDDVEDVPDLKARVLELERDQIAKDKLHKEEAERDQKTIDSLALSFIDIFKNYLTLKTGLDLFERRKK